MRQAIAFSMTLLLIAVATIAAQEEKKPGKNNARQAQTEPPTHADGGENLLTLFLGGTIDQELGQVKSPDGRSVASLFHRHKLAPGGPPEPPKTLERWARLTVSRDGKPVYDSGYENLNIYQMSAGLALDVMWSPDSKHLAYRHIASLRVIDAEGKATTYDVAPEEHVISSFGWIDNECLLVVSKKTSDPFGAVPVNAKSTVEMSGEPYMYNGYTDAAEDICITRLDLHKGKTERYKHALAEATGGAEPSERTKKRRGLDNKPTFLFHAITFRMDEISPNADRVAFSDGDSLCLYDDTAGKVVARVEIPQKLGRKLPPPPPAGGGAIDRVYANAIQEMAARPAQLEGVWWQTNDRVVIGIGLMSSSPDRYAFHTYDIPSKALTDRSGVLVPLWLGSNNVRNYQEPDWFRAAIR